MCSKTRTSCLQNSYAIVVLVGVGGFETDLLSSSCQDIMLGEEKEDFLANESRLNIVINFAHTLEQIKKLVPYYSWLTVVAALVLCSDYGIAKISERDGLAKEPVRLPTSSDCKKGLPCVLHGFIVTCYLVYRDDDDGQSRQSRINLATSKRVFSTSRGV